jgi:hypothetical protein
MQTQIISTMISDFEHGRLSRRQLITHLLGIIAAGSGASAALGRSLAPADAPAPASPDPTFQAVDLHHIALNVSDVRRSQQWYQQHLGLRPTGTEGFLTTGKGWLALFKGQNPGLHHYCYSIERYNPDDAVATLKAAGLTPRRRGGRVYFDDPDGIECQIAQAIQVPGSVARS